MDLTTIIDRLATLASRLESEILETRREVLLLRRAAMTLMAPDDVIDMTSPDTAGPNVTEPEISGVDLAAWAQAGSEGLTPAEAIAAGLIDPQGLASYRDHAGQTRAVGRWLSSLCGKTVRQGGRSYRVDQHRTSTRRSWIVEQATNGQTA